MNKNWYVALILLIISMIIAIMLILDPNNPTLSPNNQESVCTQILDNGPNKINLLFVSTKETAQIYTDYFFANSPFEENKESFNVYVLEKYTPECERYKGIALLCYSRALLQEAAKCPNEYIIVPLADDPEIRSSSYDRVITINTNHEKSVLLHEFGHAFGKFGEEYVPASLPLNAPNCVSSCETFNNQGGCFEGCSKENYKRSIQDGVMRTLDSNQYGPFNEQVLIEKIQSKRAQRITANAIAEKVGLVSQTCNSPLYIMEIITATDGSMSVKQIDLTTGCAPSLITDEKDTSFEIKDRNGEILQEGSFFPTLFTDGESRNGELEGETFLDQSVYLTIPASREDQTIVLRDSTGEERGSAELARWGAEPCLV